MSDKPDFDERSVIAIVGMAARFPKSPNVRTYWKNLRAGVECLRSYDDEALEAAGETQERVKLANYVKVGGPLEGMADFDAGFFGFSPRDASILDPQHRHLLECAWEALEDAGIDPERFEGSIGVFAGSGHNAYMPYNLLTNPKLVESVGFFLLRHTGNDKDFLSTRISYCLKLTGPSINIQTACSTSAVAIHVACQSLLNGECDLALAGGVTIELPHGRGYLYEEGEILSPDGHCRAFDAASQGTVFGSGAGLVLLRRYSDALASGDPIHALIRGSAVNNDGANKVGYLAPSVEGQAACISEALALSEVDPATITYVECHGTGTPVGDPIEAAALTQAFREGTDAVQFCAIGSVKTNIGHTDTAAGVASVIKAAQALEHKELPPSLHYQKPNPQIDFAASPFYVNAALKTWESQGEPRRAGVNSLGVGGTNAFIVLEEAPLAAPSGPSRPSELVLLSARSPEAVDRAGERLADYVREEPGVSLGDVAYTLGIGRRAFPIRRMVVATGVEDLARALSERDPTRVFTERAEEGRSLAFVFPGGGAQYAGMGRELYEREPAYRSVVDECLTLLRPRLDYDLKALMFPNPGDETRAGEELQHGSRSLPSLFITEYALAKLLMTWGLEPTALLGHSMGEYVAACLAGVFSVDEGLQMVLLRGQLFEQIERGAMLNVPLSRADLAPYLGSELDIAVVNGPAISVVAGPVAAIDLLEKKLTAQDVDARRIRIHVAAHSRMLDPILPKFLELTRRIALKPPIIPFLSNVSGTWITEREATDPAYWVRHLRSTVQFSDNLKELLADQARVILEVAPGRTLSNLVKAHPSAGLGRKVLPSLRHADENASDLAFLQNTLGRLWLAGVSPNFRAYHAEGSRRRVSLPTYPFEHQRYWVEPGKTEVAATTRSLKKRANLDDWFYQPSFRREFLPVPSADERADVSASAIPWLVFLDDTGFGRNLVVDLRRRGQAVITVTAGPRFQASAADAFTLSLTSPEDYEALLSTLEEQRRLPGRILHLTTLERDQTLVTADDKAFETAQARGFFSLLYLAQALGKVELPHPVRMAVVSNQLEQVAGEPLIHPERATVLGPCKVITQELPNISCKHIDIVLPEAGSWQEGLLLERVPNEVTASASEQVVVYRGQDRFVQRFEQVVLPKTDARQTRLREGGVYLITGGLGGLGLVVASHLAKRWRPKLVLLGRTPLPPRERWDAHLSELGEDDKTSQRIRQVRQLEQAGAEVLLLAHDVADGAALRASVGAIVERFGALHGVFHTAGVLDDGIIALKTREQAERVLSPKVRGTLALDRALAGLPLDFIVLFSSVSSFTGLAGQVDYAAANAFLDAFARTKSDRDGIFTVAINWNAWQQVGMAAELGRELGIGGAGVASKKAHHPLLDRSVVHTPHQYIYETDFRTDTHWLLAEHRIKGGYALIPGTGYLELIRAALSEEPEQGQIVELREVYFDKPFVVRPRETRRCRVVLTRAPGHWNVTVTGSDGAVHARSEARYIPAPKAPRSVLSEIRARCGERTRTFDSADDPNLEFGPRWNNRRVAYYGRTEALLELELPEAFAGDCPTYALHPALMDFATAGAQDLVPDFQAETHFYVPLSYGQILVHAPLTGRVSSHVRLKDASAALAIYDVSIYGETGELLVAISDFVMRRIEDRAVMTEVAEASAAHTIENRPDNASDVRAESHRRTGNPILELGLEQGILPEEGMAALERVLAGPMTPELVVSSQDLLALMESMRRATPSEAPSAASSQPTGTKVTRPSLATPFVAAESDLEKTIAKVWEEILGVDGIGVHDDFFDLGGHSLLLTQLVGRVRKQVKAEISLRSLFEKRTVRGIAEEIQKASAEGGKAAPALKRVSREAYKVKT